MAVHAPGYDSSHADIPALIMGNGPSLANVDFTRISRYATFGMNAAYRYWEKIDVWPDYYSCLDPVVGDSHLENIARLIDTANSLGIKRFLLRHSLIKRLGRLSQSEKISSYEQLLSDGILPKLTDVTTGSHTMLWAERLGYSTMLLAGVDCEYVELVEGAVPTDDHLVIRKAAPNPNYFFPDYQRPGDRYNVPNASPDMHVRSWKNAARHLGPGTDVINLNPKSRVDVFPYNTGERFLDPGERTAPSRGSTAGGRDRSRSNSDMRRLETQIRLVSGYVPSQPMEVVLSRTRSRLTPSTAPLVARWRRSIVEPIELAAPGERGPQADSYLTLIVRHLGDLQLHRGARSDETEHARLLLYDPRWLPQLTQLVSSLHEELAHPPFGRRVAALLGALGTRAFSRLPLRLRRVNYAALLNGRIAQRILNPGKK